MINSPNRPKIDEAEHRFMTMNAIENEHNTHRIRVRIIDSIDQIRSSLRRLCTKRYSRAHARTCALSKKNGVK